MKKLAWITATAAALSFGSAAHAGTVISFSVSPGATSGTYQSGFGPANLVSCDVGPAGCAGSFTATGSFSANPGWRLVGATLTTGPSADPTNNIDFYSASLNGVAFNLFSPDGGVTEFGSLAPITMQLLNTLNITGYTGGSGTFAGTLTFSQAVPEPATWALMLLGFGAIGFAMRRRRVGQSDRRIRLSYS
ncbi:PEPxxWA-CTERM sorting domain-containing protein [Altererythrobacter salegens]|uniref:PEPxxWA-CTERM sorting domain-containing protein n=1 Tax=Croceibacterium salegens TaxID=1737568 RepID=A0A6I4T0D2_9SPHN|nr:FxDxF family PEP-CTERM protein [Croceibacterium salegens]MXO60727.1 PEPxxWA-CTERM sorting domain-containing protein [Croceibacterium salegens]